MTTAPSVETVCAVVVTYHPDEGLADRLAAVIDQVACLVVVDNGSGESAALEATRQLDSTGRVRHVVNGENVGLARAFNQGLEIARDQGCAWGLLLDQDSVPDPALVETLTATWHAVPQPPWVAVVGANYLQGEGGPPFSPEREVDGWRDLATVISSGSLVSLDACSRIGGMRDELFIDYVDHEFCLRARAAGYRVILSGPVALGHTIGEVERRSVAGRSVGTSGHSADRRYYQARNQLVVLRRFLLREPGWALRDVLGSVRSLIQMTLVGRDRTTSWAAVAHGVLDGLRGRGGPR